MCSFSTLDLKDICEEVDHKMLPMKVVRVGLIMVLSFAPLTASPGSMYSSLKAFTTSNVAVPNSPCHQGPAGNHIDSTQCPSPHVSTAP